MDSAFDGISLRQIRVFIQTAKYENFTKAAEELNMTQATVSRNIASLEEILGIVLFVRHNSRARLTEAGKLLEKELIKVMNQFDMTVDKAYVLQECRYNTLRIGDFDTTSEELYLNPIVEKFEKEHPDVEVTIVRDNPLNIVEGMQKGQYDAVFVSSVYQAAFENIRFTIQKIKKLVPCIIISKRNSLYNKEELSYKDFLEHHIITLDSEEYPGYNKSLNKIIKQLGFDPLKCVYVKNPHTIKSGLRRSDSMAILDEFYTPTSREEYRYIPIKESEELFSFDLVYGKSDNPNVAYFAKCAQNANI